MKQGINKPISFALVVIATLFSLATIGFLFMPLVGTVSAANESIIFDSIKVIFGGEQHAVTASGDYYFSFKLNIYIIVVIQLSALCALSNFLSYNSNRNVFFSIVILAADIVMASLIPFWVSKVNSLFSLNEIQVGFGYIAVLVSLLITTGCDVALLLLNRKQK